MTKTFLGSVGEVSAFRMHGDGTKEFMFTAKTLTDQAVNISATQDELRGGTGAVVQATFVHDVSVSLTLTDIFWKQGYVEAKLGKQFNRNANDYYTEPLTISGSTAALSYEPKPITLPCSEDQSYFITYAKQGSDDQ